MKKASIIAAILALAFLALVVGRTAALADDDSGTDHSPSEDLSTEDSDEEHSGDGSSSDDSPGDDPSGEDPSGDDGPPETSPTPSPGPGGSGPSGDERDDDDDDDDELGACGDDDDHNRAFLAVTDDEVLPLVTILEMLTPQFGSAVIEIEFKCSDGGYVYVFGVRTPTGRIVEMKVNAVTGQIIPDDD